MIPDAIIIPTSGSVLRAGAWHSTSYEDRDAFGTLGGHARIKAAAILARRFPDAVIVTTSRRGNELPTHARIAADELIGLGVARESIVLEEKSETSRTQLEESLALAMKEGWSRVLIVANEYHIPRLRTFCEHVVKPAVQPEFISAESVLVENNPDFQKTFDAVKQTGAYQERLAAEARGIEAIKSGTYHSAAAHDKQERAA